MFNILNLTISTSRNQLNYITKLISIKKIQTSCRRLGNCEASLYLKKIEDGIKKLRIYEEIDLPAADLDWLYLLNEKNIAKINENKVNRKANGDILKVVNS